MKNKTAVTLLSALGLALAMFVQVSFASSQGRKQRREPPSPDQRVERLNRYLNLSDDQKTTLRSVFDDEARQVQTVRDDTSLSSPDRKAKLQQIHEQTQVSLRQALNPDQLKKYDERRGKNQGRNSYKGRGRYRGQ